jgi:hypothetical protein
MTLSVKVGKAFSEWADALKARKANHFKVSAVRKAADIAMNTDLEKHVKENSLTSIKGIGKELAEKILEINEKGFCKEIEDMKKAPLPAKSTEPNSKVLYYWAKDTNFFEEMPEWGPEQNKMMGFPEKTRLIIVIFIPKQGWDKERFWDDGSRNYSRMQRYMHGIKLDGIVHVGEMQECVYEVATVAETDDEVLEILREALKKNELFQENPDIVAPMGDEEDD